LISPKTLALMTRNHLPDNRLLREMTLSLFSEGTFDGVGFGLGSASGWRCSRSAGVAASVTRSPTSARTRG